MISYSTLHPKSLNSLTTFEDVNKIPDETEARIPNSPLSFEVPSELWVPFIFPSFFYIRNSCMSSWPCICIYTSPSYDVCIPFILNPRPVTELKYFTYMFFFTFNVGHFRQDFPFYAISNVSSFSRKAKTNT